MVRVFVRLAAANALLALLGNCQAVGGTFETELPPIGEYVNYFTPEGGDGPVLTIAKDVPAAQTFSGEVAFGGERLHKHADLSYASPDFINVVMTFSGSGLKSALLDDLRMFDEYLCLVGPNGSIVETARNSSYSWYTDSDDRFSFAWDFFTPGDLLIEGLAWQISPDVVPGKQLPPSLDIEMFLWGSPIRVVPEPAVATLVAWGSATVTAIGRRRSRRSETP